jgi:hypothetical protein
MINYTKDINAANFGTPYIEVEQTDGAVLANNGKYYLTKEQIESRFSEGSFHLTFLHESDFIQPIEPSFSLEAHKREIEAATDDHVNQVVRIDYWYKNEGELSIRATKENRHKTEATALSLWVIVVYDALEDYLNEVSEETHLSVEDFINSLPQPNV